MGHGLSFSRGSRSYRFELLNFTEDTQQVEVTITDEDGNNVLEETYEIEERRDGPRVIREEGFTEATNGETFDIVIALLDREREERIFRVTCNENGNNSDLFFAEIHEKRDGEYTYFEFQQSTCSGGL